MLSTTSAYCDGPTSTQRPDPHVWSDLQVVGSTEPSSGRRSLWFTCADFADAAVGCSGGLQRWAAAVGSCDDFLFDIKKRPAQRAARAASRGPAVNRPPARTPPAGSGAARMAKIDG